MSIEALTQQCVLVRNATIFASKVDDDVVMMDEKQGSYFGLNSVAGKIWELLANPLTYSALLDHLVETFEIEMERCDSEVKPFLLKMIEHRLVSIESRSSGP